MTPKPCSALVSFLETLLLSFSEFAVHFLNAGHVFANQCFLNLLLVCLFACVFFKLQVLSSQSHCTAGIGKMLLVITL